MGKTHFDIKYDSSQCQIDLIKGQMTRKDCKIRKPYRVYEANGCWKISTNFVNHLKMCHKSVPATGAEPNLTPSNVATVLLTSDPTEGASTSESVFSN